MGGAASLGPKDSLQTFLYAQPSHAQQAAQPYLDGIFEASEHIKKEITRNGESNSPSNSHRVRLTIATAWLVRQVIRSQT